MSLAKKIVLFFVILILCFLAYIGYQIKVSYDYSPLKTTRIIIKKGQSAAQIANTLKRRKVIANEWVFLGYVRLKDQAAQLKPGEYDIPKAKNLGEIVDQIVAGRSIRYQITIPEGVNANKVCELFAQKKLIPKDDCWNYVTSPKLFLKDSTNIDTLEGYLFPETYFFEKSTKPQEMIQTLVNQFYKVITPKRLAKARKMNLTLQEWVTFASLIEKETGYAKERPLISGVFHNRLQKGMLLQTDPSVIYGVRNFDGNLTRKHLQTDTPYNTYTRKGLPKGPITNPGEASLLAVIEPQKTQAYYFVAKGKGRHYFSQTLSQHNAAVRYYILKVGAKPRPGEEEKFFSSE